MSSYWRPTRRVTIAASLAALALLGGPVFAKNPSLLKEDSNVARMEERLPLSDREQVQAIKIEEVSRWLKARFSDSELEVLSRDGLQLEARFCGCDDQPTAHFPYAVIVVSTPKGDLIGRPDSVEGSVRITPLADRYGTRYCEVGSEDACYGSFADVCQFTDFRYGSHLQPFFPTCKPDHVVQHPAEK